MRSILIADLLSAFSHCDSLNAIIRIGNQQIPISDGQIRFERASEARAKSVGDVEDVSVIASLPSIDFIPS